MTTRRTFLQSAAAASVLAAQARVMQAAHAGHTDVLKVGLVGCGGRGTGAAVDTLKADPQTRIVALGDLFPAALDRALANLKRQKEFAERIDVPAERMFSGFDAYKQVIDADVDVVLLATPPGFRPLQFEYAVQRDRHVFCEKPVSADPAGCRRIAAACEVAAQKGLTVVSGLCWRYEHGMQKIIQQIHDGAIGDIKALYSLRYNQGVDKRVPRTPEMTEMEFQIHNWYYFTWLSADFFAEQFVHELDKMSWLMQNEYPMRCTATGGRETRVGDENGNVFDHIAAVFEYSSGLRYVANARQQANCSNYFQDFVVGTKGTADLMKYQIDGELPWRLRDNVNEMYLNEHIAMYQAIRGGQPINNGDYMVKSSLMGIMARMSAYTGKSVTWEQVNASTLDLSPTEYTWQGVPPSSQVAVPGVTPLA